MGIRMQVPDYGLDLLKTYRRLLLFVEGSSAISRPVRPQELEQ